MRRIMLALVAALALAFMMLPAQAAAPDLLLTLRATGGAQVDVTGRLTRGAAPVAGAMIQVSVGQLPAGNAVTAFSGDYHARVNVPAGVTGSSALVTVSYRGESMVTNSAVVPITAQAAPAPGWSVPVAPTPTAATTQLSIDPVQNAEAGRLASVTGHLTLADGSPLRGAQVSASLDGADVAGATTDEAGAWQLWVPIPDVPDGLSVTVSIAYAGSPSLAPAFNQAAVSVTTPVPIDTSSPTPRPIPVSPSASAQQQAVTVPAPTVTGTPSWTKISDWGRFPADAQATMAVIVASGLLLAALLTVSIGGWIRAFRRWRALRH